MTPKEQKRIIREMLDSTRRVMLSAVDSGKVPDDWDGRELREWYAAFVRGEMAYRTDAKCNATVENWRMVTPGV